MKKTFSAKRNALLTPQAFSLGVVVLGFVCVMGVVRFAAPDYFWSAWKPVIDLGAWMTNQCNGLLAGLRDAKSLQLENSQLRRANAFLELENASLRRQMPNPHSGLNIKNAVQADVLLRPPESPYDTLLLTRGSAAGITKGMVVIAPAPDAETGVPIGVISEVTDAFSRVLLFSAPRKLTVGSVGTSRTPIVIQGMGAGTMTASVARSTPVVVGDAVDVPGGLLSIGRVTYIDGDAASPVVTVHITPAINMFALSTVVAADRGIQFLESMTSTAP